MGNLIVDYLPGVADGMPSPEIWKDFDPVTLIQQPHCGYQVWDDFAGGVGAWTLLGDNVPVGLAAFTGGAASLPVAATDNNESYLATVADAFEISDTAGEEYKLWFEARIRTSSIAAEVSGMFVGLGAAVAADFLDDATAEVANTTSAIGFRVQHTAAPTALAFVYQAVADSAVQTPIAIAQTLVAATWYNVGFKYDPTAEDAKKIAVFIDGVEQSTYVTATNIAAATFPDAEPMGVVVGGKTGAATAKTVDVDWIRCAQVRL